MAARTLPAEGDATHQEAARTLPEGDATHQEAARTLPAEGYTAAQLLAILPVLALAVAVLGCKAWLASWREAMLGGAVAWGVALVGLTEALSAVGQLTPAALALAWLLACGAAATIVAWSRRHLQPGTSSLTFKATAKATAPLAPSDRGVSGAISSVLPSDRDVSGATASVSPSAPDVSSASVSPSAVDVRSVPGGSPSARDVSGAASVSPSARDESSASVSPSAVDVRSVTSGSSSAREVSSESLSPCAREVSSASVSPSAADRPSATAGSPSVAELGSATGGSPSGRDVVSAALLSALAALLGVLAVVAVLSPPNTWDSMTYHMARLIHWSESGTLAPYPTHILRQLTLQPGAEFVLLHLQLLSGGDYLAGLVQWSSMVGVLVGTSLIAQQLGAGRPGALCAVMYAASIPIGILESTSTQNDYVAAFWIVCATVFALRLTRTPESASSVATILAFGASVGLAMLTKATAYLVLFPIVVWVTGIVMHRKKWWALGRLALAGVVALALNSGYYGRNFAVFGSPLGPLDEGAPALRYTNDGLTFPLFVSNVVRDISINFNATPVVAINVRTLNFVRLVHSWLGVDIGDPRTTWGAEVFREQPIGLAFDENFASNPVHVVLMVVALLAVWPLRHVVKPAVQPYAGVLVAGFILFALALRWQPWHARLELPFIVLGGPLVGTLVEKIGRRLAWVLAATLLVGMLPWVVYNQARPLVGPRPMLAFTRDERYFASRPGLRLAYLGAVKYLSDRGCTRIGFTSDADGWEYPLWPLLQNATHAAIEIEQVGVRNVSATYENPARPIVVPCAIVALGSDANAESLAMSGNMYRPAWTQLDPTAVQDQVAVLTVNGR